MQSRRPTPTSSDWLSEEIFAAADAYFDSLLEGIRQARYSIDMDYYIFDRDTLGEQLIEALIHAAERGVQVRLIMDGIGSAEYAYSIAKTLSAAGVQVRIFHPHPFYPHLFRWSITQGNALQKFVHFFLYINHRDHHKLCIIDQQIIWTGSINITAKHLSRRLGGQNWHDCAVKLVDHTPSALSECFNSLWNDARQSFNRSLASKVRSNLSFKLRRINNHLLFRRIRYARQRIWICNAYFVPSPAILRAIHKACKNGVDIRLILPAKSDIQIFPLISRSFYTKLLQWGVKIYEYQPDILHAKLMLVDDMCLIGSTNLNHRSYYHDLEMDIVLNRPTSIYQLESMLLEDLQQSREITATQIFRGPLEFLAARLLRLFRYWI